MKKSQKIQRINEKNGSGLQNMPGDAPAEKL